MLALNDKVVYPGHGVAKVSKVLERCVAGSSSKFFELRFLTKEMTILVPANNCESIGIRILVSKKAVDEIFTLLTDAPRKIYPFELNASSWNKRNKSYQAELRTGDLKKIASIYRDLQHISVHKELSFGERNLLAQTEQLVSQEIALVTERRSEEVVFQMRSIFTISSTGVNIPVATL
ncbi:MAG TPA: CarD family transcriptional regulator [Candidatus Babeliales bacterium]|nr:CarD family transcriptional regulator [Candidatus Babeliales bacterium]